MKSLCRVLLGLPLLAWPVAAQAQNYTWTTNADNASVTITRYIGPGGAVTIPTSLTSLPVTSLGDNAFQATGVTLVTIPYGVTSIGQSTFANCYSLASVTISGSVASIGNEAFFACDNLTNATIGAGVANIGDEAFDDCGSLASLTFPGSVTNLGSAVFYACASLGSFYFAGNAPPVDSTSFYGVNNPTVYYLPNTVGWAEFSTNTGLEVVLWNPLIQTTGGSFGVRTNHFGFNITGTANIPIVLEACTNLVIPVWTPLENLTLTNGSVFFSEPFQANARGRFYRIRSP